MLDCPLVDVTFNVILITISYMLMPSLFQLLMSLWQQSLR